MLHLRSKLSQERSKLEASFKEYLILVLLILMMGCEKDGYEAPEEQPVYFEYHFINHAWGLQDNGWLVDGNGAIRSFEFPEAYHTGMHGDFLSLEQLEYNLGQADSVIGQVDISKLEKQIKLIQQAYEVQITEIYPQGADMGLGVYSCYKFDPEQKAYQVILLSASGDYQQYNQSPDAEKLVEWLKELVD